MLSDFTESITHENGKKICSYGLQESSYDVTLSPVIRRFKNNKKTLWQKISHVVKSWFTDPEILSVDNKDLLEAVLIEETIPPLGSLVLAPGEFVLGITNEQFNMPANVTGFLNCKSSLARLGMNMPYTTIKAGWKGYLVLEIQNINSYPIAIAVNQGIGSVFFHCVDDESTYNGQFQNQDKIQIVGDNKDVH